MNDFLDIVLDFFDTEALGDNIPEIGFEVDRVWLGPAEPDVGIMDSYVDDYTFDAWVGNINIRNDTKLFARKICEALGDESVLDAVHKILKEALDEEAENYLDC